MLGGEIMETNSFVYWKNKGGYADTLGATGLAELIFQLTSKYPKIEDKHSHFLISTVAKVNLSELPYERLLQDPGFEAFEDDKYNELKELADQYWERKKNSKNLNEEEKLLLEQSKPREDWSLIVNLKVLQALKAYNLLHTQIREADKEKFTETIRLKLIGFAEGKLSAEIKVKTSLKVSPIQAFNPAIGKGINRPKPDSATIASFPQSMMDWFEEYLRYLAVKSVMNAYLMEKDIKLIVISAGKVTLDVIKNVTSDLRGRHIGKSSIKVDVISVLNLSVILLNKLDVIKDNKINQIIHGIQTALFKNMGQVKAIMNQSFIRLPGWFYIKNNDDAEDMKYIILEHLNCLRWLDEKKSEEASLLQIYRDGLSGDQVSKIVDFLANYGMHVMRKLNDKKNNIIARTSEESLRRLVMKSYPVYSDFINNVGFKNIAKAMRNATINQQIAKAKGRQTYEIHYELFQKLKQNAVFPDKFLSYLLNFVNDYNKETARRIEQKGENLENKRALVSTHDIDDFVQLFDQYRKQSETIAMLLIAYASSKTSRKDEQLEASVQEASENEEIIIED